MKNEIYELWSPCPGTPNRLQIDSLNDGKDGLEVVLCLFDDTSYRLTILFERPIAYRSIDESFRLRTWNLQAGTRTGSLMTVQNSAWIEWLLKESCGVTDMFENLAHYCIFTDDNCIDILSPTEPKVKVLNQT